jgi:hypothetical protein
MQARQTEMASGEPGYFLGRCPAYAARTDHGPGEILERLLAKGAEPAGTSLWWHAYARENRRCQRVEGQANKGGSLNGTAQWAPIHPPFCPRLA